MTHFAKDAELIEAFGGVRLLIRNESQRFLDGRGIALTDAEDKRRLTGSGHGLEEFIGQAGELTSTIGVLEALHEIDAVGRRRGET